MSIPPPSVGLGRQFYGTHLLELVDEYREHRGLDQSTMVVTVGLRDGRSFPVTAVRVASSWVVFFTEDDAMLFVPMDEVVDVIVGRRPESQGAAEAPPRRAIGFTSEQIREPGGG